MSRTVLLPGGRDARGTLDVAAADGESAAGPPGDRAACVVACPPHPQHGGSRTDERLRAVSAALGERSIDCLRFDYGAWDGGRGERTDALNAVAWAEERYDRVGLFGYSFGGAVALSAAARGADVEAVSALAPPARLGGERAEDDAIDGVDVVADLPAVPALTRIQVCYGTRDDVVDVGPVVGCARAHGHEVAEFAAGHLFVGQSGPIAAAVADFLTPLLQDGASA